MENKKIQELKAKIEDLEETIFYIEMIDHWTMEDREYHEKYSKELRELKRLPTDAILGDQLVSLLLN